MIKRTSILAAVIFVCIAGDLSAQTYNGTFYEYYFGRQPSARAEAMGRSIASLTGDPHSYYYNPAGMASLNGLDLSGSFASPYYSNTNYKLTDAYYNFFSASYNIADIGTVGISRDYFNSGLENVTLFGNSIGEKTGSQIIFPDISIYRLTLSSQIIKDLYAGVNLNLLHREEKVYRFPTGNESFNYNRDAFYFDLGVIKTFEIRSEKLDQKINIGMSLMNVNSADYIYSFGGKLPVIFRIGASYDLKVNDKSISPKLDSYNFLLNAEYEDLFNSKYFGGFHSGFEFTFLEILSLRAGFYTQQYNQSFSILDSENIYVNTVEIQNTISEFTYGFGLNIPIDQLTNGKTPIQIKFDYTRLNQSSYREDKESPGKYFDYSIIFNWVF